MTWPLISWLQPLGESVRQFFGRFQTSSWRVCMPPGNPGPWGALSSDSICLTESFSLCFLDNPVPRLKSLCSRPPCPRVQHSSQGCLQAEASSEESHAGQPGRQACGLWWGVTDPALKLLCPQNLWLLSSLESFAGPKTDWFLLCFPARFGEGKVPHSAGA